MLCLIARGPASKNNPLAKSRSRLFIVIALPPVFTCPEKERRESRRAPAPRAGTSGLPLATRGHKEVRSCGTHGFSNPANQTVDLSACGFMAVSDTDEVTMRQAKHPKRSREELPCPAPVRSERWETATAPPLDRDAFPLDS